MVEGSAAPPVRTRSWPAVVARVLQRATMNFVEDRCTHMAAAISYFALFALFPITLLAVAIFGVVLRNQGVQADVLEAIVEALPIEATSIEDSLRAVADLGPALTIVSLLGAVWTVGTLASAVSRSVNVVFDVDRSRPILHGKLVDYSLVPVAGGLLLASFTLTAAWRVAQASAYGRLGGSFGWLWDAGALAIPAALSFLTFLFIYWLLPNRRIMLRYIWPGALVAAIGIEVAKNGFALYLANIADYDVVYGSLGGVIALLFWVYVSSNILLFGAQVAAEVPHVLFEEPRHGHTGAGVATNWRTSLLAILRGLVIAPGDQAGPAVPEHASDEASEGS